MCPSGAGCWPVAGSLGSLSCTLGHSCLFGKTPAKLWAPGAAPLAGCRSLLLRRKAWPPRPCWPLQASWQCLGLSGPSLLPWSLLLAGCRASWCQAAGLSGPSASASLPLLPAASATAPSSCSLTNHACPSTPLLTGNLPVSHPSPPCAGRSHSARAAQLAARLAGSQAADGLKRAKSASCDGANCVVACYEECTRIGEEDEKEPKAKRAKLFQENVTTCTTVNRKAVTRVICLV